MLLRVDDLAGTHAVAAAIAGLARPGDLIVLAGEMGAGKTAFAQGFGKALGVTEPITSPTFTLVHSYPLPNRLTLHHADLYRLDRTGDVDDLALHELAAFKGIVLIEWGDVAGAGLGDHLEVRLSHVDPDEHEDSTDDSDEAAAETADAADDEPAGDDDDGEFADSGVRKIELRCVGPAWAGRSDRIARVVEAYRC
jgi:tRNA threonylcarbamoyladenosine biosynthesis protein TsaE